LAEELRRWVIERPAKQGLDRANWTHEELAEHLYRSHGIRTSRSAVQRLCRKLDIRLYRPTGPPTATCVGTQRRNRRPGKS
jgi:hypothetical protein